MIGHLRGILTTKKAPFITVDVHGVGYELQASMTSIYALPALHTEVFLFTHLVVREDAQLLYAFVEEIERTVFKEIIKVSGVGPKLALAILSGMNVANFIQCIEAKDTSRLVKLPGVGKKTAERLIIEMVDKLQKQFNSQPANFSDMTLVNIHATAKQNAQQDAISALISLGYKSQEAHATIRKIYVEDADSETLIRLALQSIVK